MKVILFILPVLALLSVQLPGTAQALFESGNVRAMSSGLGAGLGASLSHGYSSRVLKRVATSAQASVMYQAQLLKQYCQTGSEYENKLKWAAAEQAFRSALAIIARRDGPGSPNSVAVLQHLSKECEAQHKLDEAIGFQKTVLALSQRDKKLDVSMLFQEQQSLSRLFVDKSDFANAEPVLLDSLGLLERNTSLPQQQLRPTMQVYGKVLRKLKRETEAAKIENAVATGVSPAQLFRLLPQVAKPLPKTLTTEEPPAASGDEAGQEAATPARSQVSQQETLANPEPSTDEKDMRPAAELPVPVISPQIQTKQEAAVIKAEGTKAGTEAKAETIQEPSIPAQSSVQADHSAIKTEQAPAASNPASAGRSASQMEQTPGASNPASADRSASQMEQTPGASNPASADRSASQMEQTPGASNPASADRPASQMEQAAPASNPASADRPASQMEQAAPASNPASADRPASQMEQTPAASSPAGTDAQQSNQN